MLTVACVLRTGDNGRGVVYTVDWVDRLYRGLQRNLDIPFSFTCLSNVETTYNTVPLESNSTGYWNKIELFKPGLFNGPVLYFDLDIIICKSITDFVLTLPQDTFLMVREPYRNIHNSSIMFWNGDYSYLYKTYLVDQDNIVNEYQYNLHRAGCLGDQAYIGENVDHKLIDDYVDSGFIEWQHHKIDCTITDPSIVIFTGSQKPSKSKLELVQQHWV